MVAVTYTMKQQTPEQIQGEHAKRTRAWSPAGIQIPPPLPRPGYVTPNCCLLLEKQNGWISMHVIWLVFPIYFHMNVVRKHNYKV